MLDQPVGGMLPRHVLGQHDVGLALVFLAELLRLLDVVGAEGCGLGAGQRRARVVNRLTWCALRQMSARRLVVFRALGRNFRRPFHDLLEQQVHEQEQRLGLEHQQHRLFVRRVVEVLMHAAVLDQHHVAGLPRNMAAVVHVMAVALEHVEHRAVEMAVLLAGGARRVGLDVRFDRLRDVDGLRRDHALAVMSGTALPGHVLRREHPRLIDQLLVEMAVGAFERADEGALLGPALPVLVFLFRAFARLIVPHAGRIFENASHFACSLERGPNRTKSPGCGSTISRVLVKSIRRRG